MKRPKPCDAWFFVDESGDPTFYNRKGQLIVGQPGCSRIFMLGFIETRQPQVMRQAILRLQHEIVNDPAYQHIPSIVRTAQAFHANKDTAEVRNRFYQLIGDFDFQAQVVVVRKDENVFRGRFKGSEREMYDHLVSMSFQNVLHRHERNHVYFAKRNSRAREQPLREAIEFGVQEFEARVGTTVNTVRKVIAQTPSHEPCLSVIDYVNWAVYRAYTTGEMQYYEAIREKVSLLVDLFDNEPGQDRWYDRKNPFHIQKATPL